MKLIHVLFMGLGLYGLWFYAQLTKPVIPSPPDSGLGLVPVTLGNAGPEPMDVRLTDETGKIYSVRIPRCPTCKILTIAPPTPLPCPSDTTYKQFALSPKAYNVQVLDQNGTNTYESSLNLTNGKAYKGCLFLVSIPPKHRDLQEQMSQP